MNLFSDFAVLKFGRFHQACCSYPSHGLRRVLVFPSFNLDLNDIIIICGISKGIFLFLFLISGKVLFLKATFYTAAGELLMQRMLFDLKNALFPFGKVS